VTTVDRAEVLDGTPLTPVQEYELYLTAGVVPSMYAIRRALGEDRDDVLAMMDRRDAQRAAEVRP